MSDKLSIIGDMSDPHFKQRMIAHVGSLRGVQRIEITRYRSRRTDRQNRFYWPCFVAPFADWLREQGNDGLYDEDAHGILKAEFLKVQVFTNGRRRVWVRSTTDLTTVEFNLYLDRCAEMLARECGIVVPDPSVYREPLDEPKPKRKRVKSRTIKELPPAVPQLN